MLGHLYAGYRAHVRVPLCHSARWLTPYRRPTVTLARNQKQVWSKDMRSDWWGQARRRLEWALSRFTDQPRNLAKCVTVE